jgi:hypothetical protein
MHCWRKRTRIAVSVFPFDTVINLVFVGTTTTAAPEAAASHSLDDTLNFRLWFQSHGAPGARRVAEKSICLSIG